MCAISPHRPFSPELGEANAWVFPRNPKNKELDDINIEDLTVKHSTQYVTMTQKSGCHGNIILILLLMCVCVRLTGYRVSTSSNSMLLSILQTVVSSEHGCFWKVV